MAGSAEVDDPSRAACVFRSLGDTTRLRILQHLAFGEHRVIDLTNHLGLAQSTVSAHLACLRDCDLVTSRRIGRASMFRIRHTELFDLLAAAETLLSAAGFQDRVCPRHAAPSPA